MHMRVRCSRKDGYAFKRGTTEVIKQTQQLFKEKIDVKVVSENSSNNSGSNNSGSSN